MESITSFHPAARQHLPLSMPSGLQPQTLSIQTLKSASERLLISDLRQYADFGSEYELDPGMAAFEKKKDGLGVVMAILQGGIPIATIRFIPAGHGVTLTERYWGTAIADTSILQGGSWEVGRLVMAPENRRPDLLVQCLAMSLTELLEQADVDQFHASCLCRMTRLYRRFGFSTVTRGGFASGQECALIHADVAAVAVALKVPMAQGALLQ
jgi:hypothetical protein